MAMDTKRKVKAKSNVGAGGRVRFITSDSRTGEILNVSPWHKNLVMNGTATGVNLIARAIAGDNTYPLEITGCKLGTGVTPPANSDTDLETPTFTVDETADSDASGGVALISFFIPTLDLPNGTYREFAPFCGNQIFARLLISPVFTKSSNQDTTIEYEVTINN